MCLFHFISAVAYITNDLADIESSTREGFGWVGRNFRGFVLEAWRPGVTSLATLSTCSFYAGRNNPQLPLIDIQVVGKEWVVSWARILSSPLG